MLSRCLLSALSVLFFSQTSYSRTALEYFWNEDPGLGQAKVIYETAADVNGSEFSIDTSSLAPGINVLGFRANINGRWSHTLYRMVAIDSQAEGKWDAEYFWNEDPGIGKATPISLSETDGQGLMSFTLDTNSLNPGINILGIRVGSASGISSTRTFLVNVSAAGDNQCIAEYFWDTDPGCGKGTPLGTGALSTGRLFEIDVPTDGLTPGAHSLGIRTMSGQTWSATNISTVYIAGEKGPGCTYAEYFWGEDPGYGKGTPIDIKSGDEVTVEDLTIDFPTETADEYALSFRSRSENGWSTTVTKIIPHLYVEEISLEADTTVMARGTTMHVRSTVNPTDAFDDRIAWSSSDESVLTVDDSGNVKALGAGTATITATALDAHGVTGEIEIEVIVPVESIAIEPAELKLSVTDTCTLTAKVMPEDATDRSVTWTSDNPETVQVDEEGIVTALATGTAVITVTANDGSGTKAECTVTVTDENAVQITPSDNLYIEVKGNEIRVSGKDASTIVKVYDMEGRILRSTKDTVISGLEQGVYIVAVGNYRIKVRI